MICQLFPLYIIWVHQSYLFLVCFPVRKMSFSSSCSSRESSTLRIQRWLCFLNSDLQHCAVAEQLFESSWVHLQQHTYMNRCIWIVLCKNKKKRFTGHVNQSVSSPVISFAWRGSNASTSEKIFSPSLSLSSASDESLTSVSSTLSLKGSSRTLINQSYLLSFFNPLFCRLNSKWPLKQSGTLRSKRNR